MLHYYAKKFFAPVIVTAHLQRDGEFSISLVSDLLEDLPNVELKLTVFRWSSWTPVFSIQKFLTLVRSSI